MYYHAALASFRFILSYTASTTVCSDKDRDGPVLLQLRPPCDYHLLSRSYQDLMMQGMMDEDREQIVHTLEMLGSLSSS